MGSIKRRIVAVSIFIIVTCIPIGTVAFEIEVATRQATWGSVVNFVKKPNVTDVNVENHSNKTRVLIDISRPLNLRYDTSSNGTAVFLQFSGVEWNASPFEPRHSNGNVLEFKFSPETNGGRLNILTDTPVSVKKPFLLNPDGKLGHRIVIDLIPELYPGQRLLTGR